MNIWNKPWRIYDMDRPNDELECSARTIAQGELDTIHEYVDQLEKENKELKKYRSYHEYCKSMLDDIRNIVNEKE